MAYYSPTESFNAVKGRIEKSVASYFPLKGVKHTLHAKRVWVDDNKTPDDLKDQKSAKTRGRSWAVPIKAEMELVDNRTGKVVDQRTLSLAQLPKTTRRNSYIVDGSEYQVTNLFRRKPGVYTREKANGDLVSEWNLSKGKNFKIGFDPNSKKLTMAVGNANIPLYSVMKAIGVDDDTLERRWGKEILNANRVKNVKTGQQSYYRAMTGEKPESAADAVNLITTTLEKSTLDPETTKVTLGKSHEQVTSAALLDGTRKLLDVSRGKAQMDDRDSLKFKELGSVEDLLGTRLDHWRVQKDVVRKLTNSLDRKNNIRSIISPDTFGAPIKGFFTSSPLAERPTQSNPVEFLTGARKTTLLAPGEGGIQSTYEIPLEAKSINPSQLGFLDPNHTPESKKTGVTLQLAGSVVKDGRDLKLPVYNVRTGKNELITASQAASSTIAFPDQFSPDLKPLKSTVRAKGADGDIMTVPAAKVDYVYRSSKGMFDVGTNLIPFLQNNQGNRTMVAARQMEQALSLRNREAPLVQVRSDGAKTYEKLLGDYAAHIAPADGVVTRVTQDDITLKTAGGLKKVPIYNNFPLNDDRSALNAYPTVKAGDKVVKGQVLADTNYTKDGTLALGTNLNVAYTPWRGYNFEDAVLVSESAAKKLTSQHMFKESVSDEEKTRLNKRKFLSYMAGKVTKEQAEKLDDRGVVKPGEVVHKDDILIGALREETVSPEERKLGLISKGFVRPFKPREIRWTHDTPGVVSQVVTSGKNTTVYIKTDRPATIGDKIVGRHGNKGTISEVLPDHEMPHDKSGKPVDLLLNQAGIPCYDEETEFLTTDGWVRAAEISEDHTFATLNRETLTLEFQKPEEVFHIPHRGKMYRVENQQLDMMVTPNHKQFVAKRGHKKLYGTLDLDDPEVPHLFDLEEAQEVFGKPRRYLKAAKWEGESDLDYTVLSGSKGATSKPAEGFSVSAAQWAEFWGWYLSEGSAYRNPSGYGYTVEISQSRGRNPATYAKIESLLQGMALKYHASPTSLTVKHKGLYERLHPLGKARDKYIPREILDMHPRHLQIFLDALMEGDGSETWNEETGHYGCRRYWTSSKALADGVQEVAAKLGIAANIKQESRRGEDACYYISLSGSRFAPWTNWSSTTKANQVEEWVDYDGVVHCATVPNGVLLVRRNGKPVFSGNTRINLGQVLETVAAKVAKKTGKTYKVNNFDPKNQDYTRNMLALMQRYGVSDREELYDPKTKKSLGKVLTGPQYILKLHHMAEKKLSARSRGAYDSNMLPKGGGPEGGQTMDALGLYATLAHNARENVREFQSYKSDKDNDDVWAMIQQGDAPPTPKVPFVFEKFKGYLQGMGLDTVKDGNELILQPLTDAKVRRMSNGALEDPGRTLLSKNLKPEKGGIYDEAITGGVDGKKWSHIELPERIPNPVFEKPIRALLGLTGPAYEKIVTGEARLGGETGPKAIVAALKGINEKRDLEQLEKEAPLLRSAELDKANKKIKYLRAVGRAGMSVKDAYTLKALPVLPPVMRPFTVMDSGDITYDDTTRLYNRMGHVKRQLDSWDPGLPSEEKVKLEYGMYDGVKALMLSGAIHQGKHRNSIAQLVAGGPNRPAKKAFFQDKVIGRRQDLSLRGVISPDPAMSIDEIGLPKKAAMELYKPFVVGHLARRGYPVLEAQELVRRKHPVVDDALKQVVSDRPVLVKRDPVLHKFGVQAFYPRLVGGSSVKIHPLVTGGYNADFDGDSMSAYVPVSTAAVKEARGMVPSANLFNPATGFLVHKPGHESVLGLYKITEMKGKPTRRFATPAAAAAAASKGEIKLTDPIVVDSIAEGESVLLKTAAPTRTTLGRMMVYHSLPKDVRDSKILTDPDFRLDKGGVHDVLSEVAKKSPGDFGTSAEKLKLIGDEFATGKSVGLSDFLSVKSVRDPYLRAAKEQEIKIRASRLSSKEKEDRIVEAYTKAGDLARSAAKKKFDAGSNDMYDWVKSKARGSWTQFSQMTVAPFLVADPSGKPMPIPIGKSYSEGLDIASFMASMHGARMGTLGRSQGTEAPGRLAKHLVRTAMDQVVVSDDCKVAKGVTLPVDDRDVLDRYTAKPIDLGVKAGNKKGIIPPGTVVTPGLLNRLKNNKIDRIEVRSPLRCAHGKGVCAKCYGLNSEGQPPSIGTNLGIIAAHSLSEPAVQLAMNAFHEGGIVGAKGTAASKKFKRVEDILAVPERLRGAAVLSEATGTVSSVKEDKSAGGWRVTVASDSGDKGHYVRGNRTLMVTPGSKVRIGEALTSGPKNPRDVLRLSGVTAVQKYLTDELWDAYKDEGPVKRRNIETFVRSMTDLGEVRNPGSHPDFLRGDRVSISSVSEFNRNRPVGAKPVVVKPILQRAEMLPTEVSTDWLARMQTRDLKKTVLDAAAEGWKSMLHGTHPIPGMAYGKEFGKGREPWEY